MGQKLLVMPAKGIHCLILLWCLLMTEQWNSRESHSPLAFGYLREVTKVQEKRACVLSQDVTHSESSNIVSKQLVAPLVFRKTF